MHYLRIVVVLGSVCRRDGECIATISLLSRRRVEKLSLDASVIPTSFGNEAI